MTRKPVIARARAVQNVDDALTYYLAEATEKVAMGFLDALEQTYAHLSGFAETSN